MMKPLALVITTLITAPALAQSMPTTNASTPSVAAVTTTRALWTGVSGYIAQSAQDMSEADYAFRPTPEVRTFGQIIAHVAGSQMMFCAAALGETPQAEDAVEKTKTTKADLIAALKASNDYCARAYAQSDVAATGTTKLFGQDHSRLFALMQNATHDSEHYGNIVTYMRMKGLVPPSSRR
ncbi:MAG: DinB family protein [Gemmatimonadaceae bacterium]